jgi:hypothetical protein
LQASIFKHGQLEEIAYEVMGAEELYAEFFFCRLIGELEVFCADNEKSVHDCMVRLRKKLASGNVAFSLQASNVVITSNSVVGFSDSAMMGELLSVASGVDAPVKSKKAVVATEFEVMRLRLILKHSKDVGEENLPRNAPTVTVDKTNGRNFQSNFSFSFLNLRFRFRLNLSFKPVQNPIENRRPEHVTSNDQCDFALRHPGGECLPNFAAA